MQEVDEKIEARPDVKDEAMDLYDQLPGGP
jgi:hypothetical protein